MGKFLKICFPLIICIYMAFGVNQRLLAGQRCWDADVSMSGACFVLKMTAKKRCSGTVRVGWYRRGRGYWLNDSYGMIKNGREIIKGCWDEDKAKYGGGPALTATIAMKHSGLCKVKIDGKTVFKGYFQ